MDTQKITTLARHDKRLSKVFAGVFPCDLLPKHAVLRKSVFIVNTDTHTNPGSHWVAIAVEPTSSDCIYYDSYGQRPTNKHIVAFINRNAKHCRFNAVNMQAPCSNLCAAYCLFFAYHYARGQTLNNIIKMFDKRNHRKNDYKMAKFVRDVFKHTFAILRSDSQCYEQQFLAYL